jgi:RNA:NAD 2'-phosphotransferase (TPT1/KptA family)
MPPTVLLVLNLNIVLHHSEQNTKLTLHQNGYYFVAKNGNKTSHILKRTLRKKYSMEGVVKSNQVVHSSHNKRWSLFQFLTDGYIVTCEQGTQSVGRLVDVVFVAECRVESAAGGE